MQEELIYSGGNLFLVVNDSLVNKVFFVIVTSRLSLTGFSLWPLRILFSLRKKLGSIV